MAHHPPSPRPRKSSPAVLIGAVGALSLTIAGCSSNDTVTAYCVDRDSRNSDGSYRTVDEDRCDDNGATAGGGGGGYHYYYGGSRSGQRVSGGTVTRPSGVTIVTERGTTISRGGAGGRGGSGGG
ncbi:hypothetical protein ACQEU5_05710 [Marinactinospora thermotolerans]|uniref:Uncharacterized protein n=1 Tax=Marinactinospora thermotolerans DSM 45154 TaxID=1122192 RepID=A0A1T4SUW1_9ACTN|nr:hypothetical protein [Marinactinospora thermotolerans]SKA31947.1 hypothetical protein SAMN02745673_04046 [Marinactinospora thermotolerans DSM 45154]